MRIEQEVFKKSKVIFDKLIPFGFIKEEKGYVYRVLFANNAFKAEVFINLKGEVFSHVLDMEMDEEEYEAIYIESFSGGFVGTIRNEYIEILERIKKNCFSSSTFISDQANRIERLIKEKYNESPDFPFQDMENYGIFRYPDNKKWYMLIMNIKKSLLTKVEGDEHIDVANIKLDSKTMETALKKKSVFPAYHMNKKYWVTIALDDSLSDDYVMSLIDVSRELIKKRR